MRNPNADENNLTMTDFWCDFCHAHWDDETTMIEGHHGSLICDKCLVVAHKMVVTESADLSADGYECTMCLENRTQPAWRSPAHEDAHICLRCIKLAARAIEKDEPDD